MTQAYRHVHVVERQSPEHGVPSIVRGRQLDDGKWDHSRALVTERFLMHREASAGGGKELLPRVPYPFELDASYLRWRDVVGKARSVPRYSDGREALSLVRVDRGDHGGGYEVVYRCRCGRTSKQPVNAWRQNRHGQCPMCRLGKTPERKRHAEEAKLAQTIKARGSDHVGRWGTAKLTDRGPQ